MAATLKIENTKILLTTTKSFIVSSNKNRPLAFWQLLIAYSFIHDNIWAFHHQPDNFRSCSRLLCSISFVLVSAEWVINYRSCILYILYSVYFFAFVFIYQAFTPFSRYFAAHQKGYTGIRVCSQLCQVA